MRKCFKIISLFAIMMIVMATSCTSEEEKMARKDAQKEAIVLDAYQKIIQYALDNNIGKSGSSKTGYVSGSASFTFYKSAIKVFCRIIIPLTGTWSESTEIGDLTNVSIEDKCGFSDCSDNYNVSIQGRWNNRSAGSGRLVISITDSNSLEVYIFGDGDWRYSVVYDLSSVTEIIKIINEAKKEIAEIDGVEPVLVSLVSDSEREAQSKKMLIPGGAYTNNTNKETLIFLYPDEIEQSSEGDLVQKLKIEGYSPVYKRNGSDLIEKGESFARGAKKTMEADLVLRNEKLYDTNNNEVGIVNYSKPARLNDNGIGFYYSKDGGYHMQFKIKTDKNVWYEGTYEVD